MSNIYFHPRKIELDIRIFGLMGCKYFHCCKSHTSWFVDRSCFHFYTRDMPRCQRREFQEDTLHISSFRCCRLDFQDNLNIVFFIRRSILDGNIRHKMSQYWISPQDIRIARLGSWPLGLGGSSCTLVKKYQRTVLKDMAHSFRRWRWENPLGTFHISGILNYTLDSLDIMNIS